MASAEPLMSLNNDAPGDSIVREEREEQAKYSGHLIYDNIPNQTRIMHPPISDASRLITSNGRNNSIPGEDGPDGSISSSRRTFCLYALFDLGLMFILWVIYTQLIGATGYKAFEEQVLHYNFKTSLFDSVMLSAVRVTLLLLAYGLYRSSRVWVVAFCTVLTCAILITKIFIYHFGSNPNNPLSYCLIIISFVLSWSETWFVDFKLIPSEEEARNQQMNSRYDPSYGSTLLGGGRIRPEDLRSVMTEDNTFYSPVDSPEGSDTEDGVTHHSNRNQKGAQENDYLGLARHATEVLWQYLHSPESEWSYEKGSTVDDGVVHSKKIKGVGKVFRLKCYIDMAPQQLYDYIVFKPEEQVEWNATVKECRVLQVVDDHTDILYIVSNELAGGAIKSRDFISLRTWCTKNGKLISAGIGVKHPGTPEYKNYIRGYNGIGGYVYDNHPTDPNKTLFYWFMNTDIKGWFPQKLIDASLGGVLIDFQKDLCKQIAVLNEQNGSATESQQMEDPESIVVTT